MPTLEEQIETMVDRHRTTLALKIKERTLELVSDNTDHQEVYRVLGIPEEECPQIDHYQNMGRFVYKYAGSLLEEATQLLLRSKGQGSPVTIPNTVTSTPKNFHIDCFTKLDNKAHEIKWRDATTDGDHIRKEHNKIESILAAGRIPVRIMYYMPVRAQAIKVQKKIIGEFRAKGEAYVGDEAWQYVKDYSGIDLRKLLLKSIPAAPAP